MTALLRAVTRAYRSGKLPARGYGVLFDRTPARLWGGESVAVDTEVGTMQLPLRDHGPRQILTFGHILHEVAETRLLHSLASRIACAFDIGANVGWYARLLGTAGVDVLAFEPSSRTYPYLVANVERLPSCRAFRLAVGADVGQVTFYEAEASDRSSASIPVGEEVTVSMTTVDQLVKEQWATPDLIKCDVEGGELDVLRGAAHLRGSADAPIWLLETIDSFLADQNLSYDDLETEIDDMLVFVPTSECSWTPISRLRDKHAIKSGGNVLLVPPGRMALLDGLLA